MINVARAPVLDTKLKYILLMVAGTATEAIIEPQQFCGLHRTPEYGTLTITLKNELK